jgi:hypothetical protein
MNVFISIIEEAYVSTKIKNQNHWIYSYLKIDPRYVELKDIDKGIESPEKKPQVKPHSRSTLAMANSFDIGGKEQRRIVTDVKSKNILREFISSNKPEEINKDDVEKILNSHFNTVIVFELG